MGISNPVNSGFAPLGSFDILAPSPTFDIPIPSGYSEFLIVGVNVEIDFGPDNLVYLLASTDGGVNWETNYLQFNLSGASTITNYLVVNEDTPFNTPLASLVSITLNQSGAVAMLSNNAGQILSMLSPERIDRVRYVPRDGDNMSAGSFTLYGR